MCTKPRPGTQNLSIELAELLQWRTGWHGVVMVPKDAVAGRPVDTGRRMLFLMQHRRGTYLLDLEAHRSGLISLTHSSDMRMP